MRRDSFRQRRRWGVFYVPFKSTFAAFLVAIFGTVVALLSLDIIGVAFKTLFPGLGTSGVLLLLASSLLGSYVNIPVHRINSERPIAKVRYVSAFGIKYQVPTIEYEAGTTLVAINLGGAVVPALVSFYLISIVPQSIPYILVATTFVAIVTRIVSRPIVGIGVAVPGLVPPLNAALAAMLLGNYPNIVAYIAGSMGTLIGADLLNLRAMSYLGSPILSIGGAGTFDGVFFSGIIAVILAG